MPDTFSLFPDIVFASARANHSRQLFEHIAQAVEKKFNASIDLVYESLILQEQKTPSGIGDGIAIPQARIIGLSQPVFILARVGVRIMDIKTLDHQPIDLIGAVLSPYRDGTEHLQRVARASRLLRNGDFVDALRKAETTDDINMVFRAYLDDTKTRAA